jgi:CHASE2 domain-containing sensor protein
MHTRTRLLFTGIVFGVMVLLCLVLEYVDAGRYFYDLSAAAYTPPPCDSIVIVGIDEHSLQRHGSWPWSRSLLAGLFTRIAAARPRVLAPTILFPPRNQPEQNDSLARALARAPLLSLPFRMQAIHADPAKTGRVSPLTPAVGRFAVSADTGAATTFSDIHVYHAQYINPPDSQFLVHADHSGFQNVPTPSHAGRVREVLHLIQVDAHILPSFGLCAAAAFTGSAPHEVVFDRRTGLHLPHTAVSLSTYAASLRLNFRGPKGTYTTIPAADILDGAVDPARLEDKLVFVGITDPLAIAGFFDTPVADNMSSVEIWATAAGDILQKKWIEKTPRALRLINIALMLLLFPGLVLLVPSRTSSWVPAVIAVAVTLASIMASFVCMESCRVFWNPTHHVIATLALGVMLFGLDRSRRATALTMLDLEPRRYGDKDVCDLSCVNADPTDLMSAPTFSYVMDHCTFPSLAQEHDGQPQSVAVSDDEAPDRETIENINTISNGKLVKYLGSGGMADVFLLWKADLEVARAIKLLKPDIDENLAQRFTTESRILSNLNHPNIVQCYNVGQWNSLSFMEMEYIHGAPLDAMLESRHVLPMGQALAIAMLICRALHYAHNQVVTVYGKTYRGIIHRDLKPANIMVSKAGRIKLTDFGVARPTEVSLDTNSPGTVVGTLPYLSPEQVEGGIVTHRSDLYSLGITLYELLTGRKALPQQDPDELIRAKINGAVIRITPTAHLPKKLVDIVHTAIEVKPLNRFASAMQMHEALYDVYTAHIDTRDSLSEPEKLARHHWGY